MIAKDLDPVFLCAEDIVLMHDDQLHHFGGLSGIRDRGALESAVAVPLSTFDGSYLHADLFEMAAAYEHYPRYLSRSNFAEKSLRRGD